MIVSWTFLDLQGVIETICSLEKIEIWHIVHGLKSYFGQKLYLLEVCYLLPLFFFSSKSEYLCKAWMYARMVLCFSFSSFFPVSTKIWPIKQGNTILFLVLFFYYCPTSWYWLSPMAFGPNGTSTPISMGWRVRARIRILLEHEYLRKRKKKKSAIGCLSLPLFLFWNFLGCIKVISWQFSIAIWTTLCY